MAFRAGDAVKHGPSGETWLLACDEDDGSVYPAGWPETRANASDCELVRSATDDRRLDMLQRAAAIQDGFDRRRWLAQWQLKAEATIPLPESVTVEGEVAK